MAKWVTLYLGLAAACIRASAATTFATFAHKHANAHGVTWLRRASAQHRAAWGRHLARPSRSLVASASADPGVNVIYSNRFLEHRMSGFHPEQPTRVSTAAKLLQQTEGARLITASGEVNPASFEKALAAIRRVHDPGYVEEIRRLSESGGGNLDDDTYCNSKTFEVCVIAASAWLDAVDLTLSTGQPSFALTRPPGHHALADHAMGFCIFNFAVVAARYALDVLGLGRVAILDWDVHHGNGIADLVKDDPRIRYCSLHQEGSFPLTGQATDKGPLGNLLHIPLPAYTDMRTYGPIFESQAVPFVRDFRPDLLIVSAGYDTLTEDSLAQLCMSPSDYAQLSSMLSEAVGPSRIIFGLEGGYEPVDTAQAIAATLRPFLI